MTWKDEEGQELPEGGPVVPPLDIPPLEKPIFVDQIPDSLMDNLSKRDQELFIRLMRLAQRCDWQQDKIVILHRILQIQEQREHAQEQRWQRINKHHENRINSIEKWRAFLTNRWSPLVYVLLIALPFIIHRIVEKIMK